MRKFSRASICLPRLSPLLTLDDVFEQYVGNFGKFQKLLTVYILIVVAPLIGFNMTTNFLILLEPPHLCDKFRSNSTSIEDVNNNSSLYAKTKIANFSSDNENNRRNRERNYNFDLIYPTVVSENDWVCENSWKAKLAHVAYRGGSFCGMLVIGVLSDKYGRIPTTIFCFSIAGVAGLLTIVAASNYAFFLICRGFMGFVSFKGTVPMVLAAEYVGSDKRSLVSNGLLFMVGITNVSLPWIAYFLRDWRILTVLTSAAMFIVPMITLLIPESARWLLSKGDLKKSKRVLRQVAKINGVELNDEILNNIKSEGGEHVSIRQMFKYKRFLKLYLVTTIMWIMSSMISYGGNLYVAVLSSHPFLMLSINSALDVVASVVSKWIADAYGRKKTVFVTCILSMITYVSTAFVPQDSMVFIFVLFVGRFWITITYNVKFLYAAEICPTVIRSRAMSTRLALGAFGSAGSTAIVAINWLGKSTPLIIFGIACGINAILMLILPETVNQPLPETLQEANDLGLVVTSKIFKIDTPCVEGIRSFTYKQRF